MCGNCLATGNNCNCPEETCACWGTNGKYCDTCSHYPISARAEPDAESTSSEADVSDT
jgi:hypothetical protein